jgi:O-antigen/teichoic acid export membrane protein
MYFVNNRSFAPTGNNATYMTQAIARLPAALLGLAFAALYFLLPVEVSDVVYDLDDRATYTLVMIFLPLLVVAAQQGAFIAARDRFHPVGDAALLTIPFIAVVLIMFKSVGSIDWLPILGCVVVSYSCGRRAAWSAQNQDKPSSRSQLLSLRSISRFLCRCWSRPLMCLEQWVRSQL